MNTTSVGVYRFDLGEIKEVQRTPQGFLKIPGFVTRTGVFPYIDPKTGQVTRELRHPDDVFSPESMATLQNIPVTLDHPPTMLTPENVKIYMKGYSTDRVEVNRDLLETDLIVADKDAISAVEDQGLRELSSGYKSDMIDEVGVYNGTPYTKRQKNIRYNHIAIVRKGRAGPEVRLRMDSADYAVMTDELMPETKKIVISGQEVELPIQAANVIQDLLDRYDEMRALKMNMEEMNMKKDGEKKDADISQKNVSPQVPVVQMAPDGKSAGAKSDAEGDKKEEDKDKKDADGDKDGDEKKDAEIASLKKDAESMKAKMDAMQAKMDEEASKSMNPAVGEGKKEKMDAADTHNKYIRNRVKLERAAEKVVAPETAEKFDSMSDDEIRAAAIKARHPHAELDGKSTVYLQTRFDSIAEELAGSEKIRKEMGSHVMGGNRMDSAQVSDPSAARRKMIEASKQGWNQPLSANKK